MVLTSWTAKGYLQPIGDWGRSRYTSRCTANVSRPALSILQAAWSVPVQYPYRCVIWSPDVVCSKQDRVGGLYTAQRSGGQALDHFRVPVSWNWGMKGLYPRGGLGSGDYY
jgi:hypothetical protein